MKELVAQNEVASVTFDGEYYVVINNDGELVAEFTNSIDAVTCMDDIEGYAERVANNDDNGYDQIAQQ